MRARLALVGLLMFPWTAEAGLGASYAPPLLSAAYTDNANLFGFGYADYAVLPTLDVRWKEFTLQLHVLDLLGQLLINEDIIVAGNGWYHLVKSPMPGKATAVLQPGGQLELGAVNEQLLMTVLLGGRGGVELGEGKGGFGVYALPYVGVQQANDDLASIVGGQMQISVFY